MTTTPDGINAYNGQYTQDNDFLSGNPYDPEMQPEQYAQWVFQHPTLMHGAGAPFNGGRLGLIAALMAAPYNFSGGAGDGVTAAAGGAAGGGGAAAAGGAGALGGAFGAGGIGTTLVGLGAGALNGAYQAHEAGQNREQQAAESAAQLAQQKLLTEEQLAQNQKQFDTNQGQIQSNQALNATQMDPFKQAKGRENLALLSALLSGGSLNAARQPGQLNQAASFISPDAMQAQEGSFNANAAQASGGKYVPPDQSKLGYLASLIGGRA